MKPDVVGNLQFVPHLKIARTGLLRIQKRGE